MAPLTSVEIDRWLGGLSTSHRTRNNYRNLIIGLFNFAKLSVADGQPKLGLVLGALPCIRSAELLRLHWVNFNREESGIDLGTDQTKTATTAALLPE